MFSLLIADDEMHIRKRLQSRIDWERLGIRSVQACDDGDIALELLKENTFDILLTDIKMPRMDGIALAYEARKRYPDIKIIIMSVYDDKEYLKSAIDMHAIGYLEKPFSLSDVEAVMKKAIEELTQKREIEAHLSSHQAAVNYYLQSEISHALCKYQKDYHEILQSLKSACPKFLQASGFLTVIADYGSSIDTLADEISDIPASEILSGLCTHLSFPVIFSTIRSGLIVFQLGLRELSEYHRAVEALYAELMRLSFSNIRLAAGIPVMQIELLYTSYQEAVICSEMMFYQTQAISYPHPDSQGTYPFKEDDIRLFSAALHNHNKEYCFQYIHNLQAALETHNCTPVRSVKNFYFHLILCILQQQQPSLKMDTDPSDYYLWEVLSPISSLAVLTAYLLELLDSHFADNQQTEQETDRIIHYLQENIANSSLSLADISSALYMSVPYLCTCFKEQTGQTIKAYLNNCRLEKAKELLLTSSRTIADISDACGFSDQNYFSKRFTKFYGISPSKFRENGSHKI